MKSRLGLFPLMKKQKKTQFTENGQENYEALLKLIKDNFKKHGKD